MWSLVSVQTGECSNAVDGSAMEVVQPAAASRYIFDPLWCRSMEFINEGNVSMSNMTVTRYVESADVYNNSEYEQGFCTGGKKKRKCLPHGVMDATPCQGTVQLCGFRLGLCYPSNLQLEYSTSTLASTRALA